MTSRYLEAFRMMWDAFPEPAMLIDGQHKVVAINAVGRLVGIVPGMKCEGLNPMRRPESAFAPPEEALRTRETVVGVSETNGRPRVGILGSRGRDPRISLSISGSECSMPLWRPSGRELCRIIGNKSSLTTSC